MDTTFRPQQMREKAMTDSPVGQFNQQQQQQQRQADGKVCPACGTVNEPEAMFCEQCGHPLAKKQCPYCGAEVEPDADYCEVCHRYIKQDVCSFCGAQMRAGDTYCPECGNPSGGVVCPTCNTLNVFSFCKKCGTALTEQARQLVKQLQRDPDYKELMEIVADYSKLENALP